MRLVLLRTALKSTYTIGHLYIDGEKFCDTLEDKVRGDKEEKVYGQTAIPYGEYEVILTMSTRFNKLLPLLLNVPNFQGVRIHSGNTDADTEGCIIVGINSKVGQVTNSRNTFTALMKKLSAVPKDEKIYLVIN